MAEWQDGSREEARRQLHEAARMTVERLRELAESAEDAGVRAQAWLELRRHELDDL